jgi:LytS/YehU family sensor histidine kinase
LGDYFLDVVIDKKQFVLDVGRVITIFISSIYFAVTTVGLFEAVYYYSNYNRAESEKQELLRKNLQTQFDTLKSQVNPHFLFNSLNSLSSLISIDAQRAEQFVEELSGVYRYLLKSNERELNTLKDEIQFIKSYVYLLTTRFGKNLEVEINVDDAFNDHLLPPLTLQLLVENSVKHNIISSEQPLRIKIFTTPDASLHVVNNLQKKVRGVLSGKVGLSNIISKYELLRQKELTVKETLTEFIVIIPLIKAEEYESIHY